MKKVFVILSIALLYVSCNNEQKQQNDRLYEENQKLKEEENERKKTEIIENIDQYLITKPNAEIDVVLGGVSNGSVSLQNTLDGVTFQKVVVEVTIIKDNGDAYRTELITFKNVETGDVQSSSFPDSNRGTSLKSRVIRIQSAELTDGKIIDL